MFLFIFFIYVVATSHCFDIGLVDNGEAYLLPSKKKIPNQDNDIKTKPFAKFNDHLEIFAKKTPYSPVTEDPGLLHNPLENEKIKESFNSDLLDIKDHLSMGITKITDIDTLGIYNSTKIRILLDNATNIYTEHFNSYFNKINETLPKNNLDREFVILDLIVTTNHLLLVTAKKLLRSLHEASFTSYNHLMKLENIILEEKKQAFNYACESIQICRHYPGFVDKMAELINEILILNDVPYNRVMSDITKTLEGKHWFIRKIMTVETRNALQLKLAPWKNDMDYMREMLTLIQTVITQRYNLFRKDNPKMKVKITAARILLDLIDNVFHADEDEYFFNLELDTTISAIKNWAEGLSGSNINPAKFINNIVEMLNFYWSSNTKEDVKVLIELIIFGTTRNEYVHEELFAKGAINRGDDDNEIHSDSE